MKAKMRMVWQLEKVASNRLGKAVEVAYMIVGRGKIAKFRQYVSMLASELSIGNSDLSGFI